MNVSYEVLMQTLAQQHSETLSILNWCLALLAAILATNLITAVHRWFKRP